MSNIASRDHYLTLALFSRRIIEALRDFVRDGKRKRLDAAMLRGARLDIDLIQAMDGRPVEWLFI